MGKLLTAFKRFPKRTSALVAVVAAAVIVPATLFAWGPDRATYTMENPADHVVFNSITNNPNYGDEREFMTVKDLTTGGSLTNTAKMVPGHEYQFQIYIHNNAATELNASGKGIAKDVTVRAALPKTVSGTASADAFVKASNAQPPEVWDSASLTSDSAVNLQFVNGSAMLHTNSQQTALPDSVITTGTKVGDSDLSGNWKGCLQYAGAVTFKVKVAGNPKFEFEKVVSKHGANKWSKNYTAQPGEVVDYLLEYKNTGTAAQDNVVVKDTLPAGMTYVAGSTILGNQFYPNGTKANDGITTTGLTIGNYAPGANAWVIFSARTPTNDKLPKCGNNLLHNVAKVETDSGSKEDYADVTVPKECQQECKYSCDMLRVDKLTDTTFKFTTTTTEQNATFKKVTYIIRNEQGVEVERKESTAKTLDYTQTTVGKFTVEAVVTFSVNGQDKTATHANCKKPFEVTEQPVYTCDSLTVTKINRTNFKFAVTHTVKGGTLKSTTYVVRNEQGTEIARQSSPDYTQTTVGKYTVEAILTFTINGQDKVVTDPKCKAPFEVEKEPETPVYTCDSLTYSKISRLEYSFTGKATATGGATIVNYAFNFGDNTPVQTVTNPTAVKHTYAKDGEYTVAMSVRVKVGNEEKVVNGPNCKVKVTVSPEECKPGVPVGHPDCEPVKECKPGIPVGDDRCKEECKPGIPMGDARCEDKPCVPGKDAACTETPKELPKTGSGDGIVALIGAGSLIAALGYYIASRRQLGA